MKAFKITALCTTVVMIAGCASTPMEPTVTAMPGKGKSFDQFAYESSTCKQYANDQVAGQAERANDTGLLEGVGGTLLGAGLGAAIGGGRGAAIGAGAGALGGTAVGASTSGHDQRGIQRQYNDAYEQCMVAKGNQVQQPLFYQPPAQTTVIYNQPPPTVVYAPPPPPPGYYAAPPPY